MIAFEPSRLSGIAANVLAGLSRVPKALPPRLFYDQQGSALFEQITCVPEYYPTRTEAAILTANTDEICARIGREVSVMHFSGFEVEHVWTDPQRWFAVGLGRDYVKVKFPASASTEWTVSIARK